MKLAIALAAAGLALTGCASSEPDTRASAGEYLDAPAVTKSAVTDVPAEESSEPEPEPAATPDGEYETDCDYQLDFDKGHTATAVAFIDNTGGIDFEAKVTATWRQANGRHLVKAKTTSVKVGRSKEVYLVRPLSDRQLDLLQSMDTERQCKVQVKIVDW